MSALSALPRHGLATAFCVLTWGIAHANDSEVRWRFFDQQSWGLLVIADTDEATDSFGSPLFQCKTGSGRIAVEGDAKEPLRRAIGNLIISDQYPKVDLISAGPGHTSLLTISFSEISGWRYGFDLSAVDVPFEQFKRTGVLEFKVGEITVHEEFKVGLEAVARFQAFCQSPSK